ncbi:SNF2-related protein [Pseudohalocynthiibacter sp. F2068]|uniref:DEAD/DEAH box helicase n=1 Tax=Pseudohalocynthiibacter sp. F2068 TaxID=2926418 RepID=UPI001FF20ED0|nr:SNF2-related protein [Pseudohalocynthiibacter sp. F2068]MCK0101970.1 Swt1 family HEPN domain-containing protein [Pseudohalocynthiibacter sp. F2068]
MHNELRIASAELAKFLQQELPKLSEYWWEKHVVERLSFQQQRIIEEKRLSKLRELDLAALLRVLDQNWYELANSLQLPREARNWVKELQTVRNKWAHASVEEAHPSEMYRDADTLERLLSLIEAENGAIDAAKAVKDAALDSMTQRPKEKHEQTNQASDTPVEVILETPIHLFSVGELVTLRSDNSVIVPVLEVILGGPEIRYRVFQDGSKATYYESQLRAVGGDDDQKPEISIEELKARLSALHLLSPSTANLFSLRSGRVNFVPYQYRPVLKLIRSDRPRLLIADEVGVGKTIEAGLVIKELRARMDISSILVICPKALVAERKWQTEMKRFDEEFTHLDGKLLRHCLHETDLEGEWPDKYGKAIVPFSLFDSELIFGKSDRRTRKDRGLLSLDPAPAFDLVIVDEAHHIRNSDTFLHQGVRYFCDNAKAVLLMTATPVQLGRPDLFTLLNVVRPDLVIDEASFEQMAQPNRFINEAVRLCREKADGWQQAAADQLQEAAKTEWGRLFLREETNFQESFDKLQEIDISDTDRVAMTRTLEDLYTFSSIINRTRRRDIGEFTTRKPQTLTVEFSDQQRDLHDTLLGIIAKILARCHGQQNVKFMMTTIRRQAASCLYGLAPLLSDILARKLDQLEVIESNDIDDDVDLSFLEEIRNEIEELLEKADQLDPKDAKIEAFIGALSGKGGLENNKALVFSTFRHTLAYLARHAEAAGLRFGLIHGDVSDEERANLRRRFALPKEDDNALDVLLSSEVGCEGLDFQFCDFLVNYDLPWNPMRVEQRIGRIDRYGQQSEAVSIVNLVTPGTVDADIYQRCLWRIGVFHHAVGGSEEILGEITQEIHDIAESFVLTEEEREKKLKQLADNGIRRIKEEQDLEEKESELFGLNVPKKSWREEIEDAESEWLSPASIKRCLTRYIQSKTGGDTDPLPGEKPLRTLRVSQEVRNALLADFRMIKRGKDISSRNWEKWLKGGDPNLLVTFDQETAAENPSAAHLTVLHPLVRQAARFLEMDEAMYCSLEVAEGLPPGQHKFALYRWTMHGIKPDEQLVAVATNPVVEAALLKVLHTAVEPIRTVSQFSFDFDDLDRLHHAKWSAAQANHIAENQKLAEHRVQSLTVSHRARVRTLEDQLSKATNDRIHRMKEAELARANADFERRVRELSSAGNTGDIRAASVMLGTISVQGVKQ